MTTDDKSQETFPTPIELVGLLPPDTPEHSHQWAHTPLCGDYGQPDGRHELRCVTCYTTVRVTVTG